MTKLEEIARAMQAAAKEFTDPVAFYVESEARRRYEEANPDKDGFIDCPGVDWDLESWKILVRAVMAAMREPTENMKEAGFLAIVGAMEDTRKLLKTFPPGRAPAIDGQESLHAWHAMIDAILEEGQ